MAWNICERAAYQIPHECPLELPLESNCIILIKDIDTCRIKPDQKATSVIPWNWILNAHRPTRLIAIDRVIIVTRFSAMRGLFFHSLGQNLVVA